MQMTVSVRFFSVLFYSSFTLASTEDGGQENHVHSDLHSFTFQSCCFPINTFNSKLTSLLASLFLMHYYTIKKATKRTKSIQVEDIDREAARLK